MLTVEHVRKEFGGLTAVDNISFEIDGGIVGLIGPNGAGKTTLFNLITGFLDVDAGTVGFNGERVDQHSPHEIAQRGLVRTFQDTRLFGDLSVEENLLIGMHQYRSDTPLQTARGAVARALGHDPRHDEVAAELGSLLELVSLEDHRGTSASSLAYGQQRRLGIGIAVAARPQMLMLDEPVAGMNDAETEACMSFIEELNHGTPFNDDGIAVFIIDHDMEAIMGYTDRVISINEGRVVADGAPSEVANDETVIRTYMGDKYEQFA